MVVDQPTATQCQAFCHIIQGGILHNLGPPSTEHTPKDGPVLFQVPIGIRREDLLHGTKVPSRIEFPENGQLVVLTINVRALLFRRGLFHLPRGHDRSRLLQRWSEESVAAIGGVQNDGSSFGFVVVVVVVVVGRLAVPIPVWGNGGLDIPTKSERALDRNVIRTIAFKHGAADKNAAIAVGIRSNNGLLLLLLLLPDCCCCRPV
mmetsp:Transcript_26937/g.74271  ORF Transcript_26937/g.74271 Transcript_26937/m.74271 type:complete len:205 (+) Transcript_26937:3108-3722(+)